MKIYKSILLITTVVLLSCNNEQQQNIITYKTTGSVERIDAALDSIIDADAVAEIIAEGFEWSEGTLWIEKESMLLFSDVPTNTIYKWTEAKGKEVYLTPSGYTDTVKRAGETGSNGLLLDANGNLILCQHGNRQMARMDAALNQPAAKFISLASMYKGKRFSSPNDAVYNSAGELFFTDPPYGLETQSDTDPKKELPFNGVYKVFSSGLNAQFDVGCSSFNLPNTFPSLLNIQIPPGPVANTCPFLSTFNPSGEPVCPFASAILL